MSVVGDAIQDIQKIGTQSTMKIQPSGSTEWTIHNLYHDGAAELFVTDNTNEVTLDTATTEGSWTDFTFHSSASQYYSVKNTDTVTITTGYDGVITRI